MKAHWTKLYKMTGAWSESWANKHWLEGCDPQFAKNVFFVQPSLFLSESMKEFMQSLKLCNYGIDPCILDPKPSAREAVISNPSTGNIRR